MRRGPVPQAGTRRYIAARRPPMGPAAGTPDQVHRRTGDGVSSEPRRGCPGRARGRLGGGALAAAAVRDDERGPGIVAGLARYPVGVAVAGTPQEPPGRGGTAAAGPGTDRCGDPATRSASASARMRPVRGRGPLAWAAW